jgi:hypothetical protein
MAILNRGMAGAPQGLQMAYMRDPRLRLAQQLQAGATDTSPVGHWSQGLARLAQALAGNRMEDRADSEYRGQAEAYQNDMRGFMAPVMEQGTAGPGPRQGPGGATMRPATFAELSERAGKFSSPYAMEAAQPMLQAAMQAQQAAANRITYKPGEQNGLKGQIGSDGKFIPDPLPRPSNQPRFAFETIGGRRVAIDQSDPTKRMDLGPAGMPEAPKEPGGPFSGNAMDAQALNFVLRPGVDTSSPTYAAAFAHLYGPRSVSQPDGTTVVMQPPVPEGVARPGTQRPQAAPNALSQFSIGGNPPAPPQAAAPQAPPIAAQPPVNGTTTPLPGGGSVTRVGDPRMSPNDRKLIEQATTDAAVLVGSLNEYVNAFERAGPGENIKSIMGVNTPVNTAFSNAALMAKGEALFNLGVLNGPDLEIIRRTLPDPSTLRGQAAGVAGAKAAAQQISKMIQDRITSHYRQKGLEPPNMAEYAAGLRAPTPPLGGGAVADNNDPLGLR